MVGLTHQCKANRYGRATVEKKRFLTKFYQLLIKGADKSKYMCIYRCVKECID